MYKRIIAILLVIAIAASFLVLPAQAGELVPAVYPDIDPYLFSGPISEMGLFGGLLNAITNFCGVLENCLEDFYEFGEAFDSLLETGGFYDSLDRDIPLYCSVADKETDGRYPYHQWYGGLFPDSWSCSYCGMSYSDFNDSSTSGYDEYVTSLADTQEVSLHLDPSKIDTWDSFVDDGYILSYSSEPNSLDYVIGKNCYWNGSRWYWQPFYSGAQRIFLSDEFFIAEDGTYTITFPSFSATLCGSLTYYVDKYVDGAWVRHITYQYSASVNENSEGLIAEYVYPGDTKTLNLLGDTTYYIGCTLTDATLSTPYGSGYYNGATGYAHFAEPIKISSSNASGTVYDPSDPEQAEDEKYSEDTRVALLMELIDQYNKQMDCQNNSDATNYFFGTVDEDGNVTGYYSPSVFSENTKIFTEPVTGAQYQTTGWTYDYETRTYDMFLEPGTFVLEGSDVIRILCAYGDYGVTITYIHPDGSIAQVDEYAYLVVASNECALKGHAYNVETTTEPTCTRVGERTYTCSVCGNQYVENIPLLEHSYTFTIIREPTCSSTGMGTYACSACGMQYTESIPALEHTGVLLEVVDTVYGESGAVITAGYSVYECSSCGTHYIEYDDVGTGTGSGFWSSLVDSFANALSSVIDAVLGLIIFILETVLGLIKDLLSFLYSFITDTVLDGISNMFAAFTDGSLWEFFQTEDGTVGLPGDVSVVFTFFSGVIMALPWELRTVLFFAIAVGVLIAIFKLS